MKNIVGGDSRGSRCDVICPPISELDFDMFLYDILVLNRPVTEYESSTGTLGGFSDSLYALVMTGYPVTLAVLLRLLALVQ